MSIPERQVLLEHVGFLRAIALGVLRNEADADDAVQQTLATALQKPPADDSNLRGWLATVVRNFARMQLRSRSRRHAREESVARPEGTPSAAQIAQRMEMERHVVDAIATLEEPFKTTLILRFYDDLQPRDIALRMGVPAATVRTRLKRGLDKLRTRLDEKSGGSRKATYAGLLLLAQLPTRAAPLRWIPVAGVAAVLIAVVSIVSLMEINSEGAREPTKRASVGDRPGGADGADAGDAQPTTSIACIVSGTVLNPNRVPRADVEVVAYEHAGAALLDTPESRWTRWIEPPAELARTTTGVDGTYAIAIDPPRPFWLVYRKAGTATRVLPVSDGSGTYGGVDMVLLPASGMQGILTDDDGKPISGAAIHTWTPEYTQFGAPALIRTTSDENGRFTLPVASTYRDGSLAMVNRLALVVDARHAGYAPRVFRDVPAMFWRLHLQRGAPLTVTAAPGTEVVAFGREAIGRTHAGDDGVARFEEFPDGDRTFVLLHDQQVARQVQSPAEVAPPQEGVVLDGVLRLDATGEPLAAAAIGVAPQGVGEGRFFDTLRDVRTDTEGRFRLRVRKAEEHTLVVAHRALTSRQLVTWRGTGPLSIPGADSFRGRVVDIDGKPVAGARVRIRRRGFFASWVRDQRRLWTGITRADGSFRIGGIPRTRALLDHTRVEVWHPVAGGRLFDRVPAEGPVLLGIFRAAPHTLSEEPALPEPHTVERPSASGEVVGAAGTPLEGIVVVDIARPQASVKTDGRGRFTIEVEGPFPHTLRFEDGRISREVRVEKAGQRLRVALPEVRTLQGRVLHAGLPVEGAMVRVLYNDATIERTQTGKNGRFTVQRWPSQGKRELVIEKPGFLTARLESPTGADVELTRAAALVVHVQDERGMARNGIELRLGKRRLVSDRNGLVRLYQPSESKPEFVVVPGGTGWIRVGEPEWSADGSKLTLVVARGERIEGRVVDSENRGVPHILVLAQPTVKGRAIRRAFTNSKGYFKLRALHPERYELRTGDAKHGVEIEAGTTGLVLREESR